MSRYKPGHWLRITALLLASQPQAGVAHETWRLPQVSNLLPAGDGTLNIEQVADSPGGHSHLAGTDYLMPPSGHSGTAAQITQSGNYNRLEGHQYGTGNQFDVIQNGDHNTAAIAQYFGYNQAAITQQGLNNAASIAQYAYGNAARIDQYGNWNTAHINQYGEGNWATISQSGTGLSLGITQTGGATVGIRQF